MRPRSGRMQPISCRGLLIGANALIIFQRDISYWIERFT